MRRLELPFMPINSTAPSFESTLGTTSQFYALESTSLREWSGPGSRSLRITSYDANDYYINFGTTTVVAASTDGLRVKGGSVEVFAVRPAATHLAVRSSTSVQINVTLGYGS